MFPGAPVWEPVQAALTGSVVDALPPEAICPLDVTSVPKQGSHCSSGSVSGALVRLAVG